MKPFNISAEFYKQIDDSYVLPLDEDSGEIDFPNPEFRSFSNSHHLSKTALNKKFSLYESLYNKKERKHRIRKCHSPLLMRRVEQSLLLD